MNLAKRICVHTEHIKLSKSWDSFLKHIKESNQKKKKAKEKDTRVQLKLQPGSTQRSTLCENQWKGAWAAGTHSPWIHGMTGVIKTDL